MRQMDTILVAVGVPTKEVPGDSFAIPQYVTVAKGTVDIAGQTTNERQAAETQNHTEKPETQQSRDAKELAETEETADGWDIPDISDLLDSLNDTESDSKMSPQKNSPRISDEKAPNNMTATDVNARCDGVDKDDRDNEHISWSWDDTHWTTENSHKWRRPNL